MARFALVVEKQVLVKREPSELPLARVSAFLVQVALKSVFLSGFRGQVEQLSFIDSDWLLHDHYLVFEINSCDFILILHLVGERFYLKSKRKCLEDSFNSWNDESFKGGWRATLAGDVELGWWAAGEGDDDNDDDFLTAVLMMIQRLCNIICWQISFIKLILRNKIIVSWEITKQKKKQIFATSCFANFEIQFLENYERFSS